MLNLIETKPEHAALMNVVIHKINDLYTIQSMFADSEDKFLASNALKNAALYMNNLIASGTIAHVPIVNPANHQAPNTTSDGTTNEPESINAS